MVDASSNDEHKPIHTNWYLANVQVIESMTHDIVHMNHTLLGILPMLNNIHIFLFTTFDNYPWTKPVVPPTNSKLVVVR